MFAGARHRFHPGASQVLHTDDSSAAGRAKPRDSPSCEIDRNSKSDGSYNCWWAHNQALLRRQRPKAEKIRTNESPHTVMQDKLKRKWSPQQIPRSLTREDTDPTMRACPETIYQALYAGLLSRKPGKLRTGRVCRKRQRRGVAGPNKIKNMRLIPQRPATINERLLPGTGKVTVRHEVARI